MGSSRRSRAAELNGRTWWVLADDLRNPVLLAREAATPDLLSDGRLELGFGAGRSDTVAVVRRLVEQLQERRETLGLSYYLVSGQALEWFAPIVERLSGT